MILLDCSRFNKLPLEIKPLYLNFISIQLTNKLKHRDLAFSQVLDNYSINQIKEAFNSVYIDKDYIITQPGTIQDKIIRLLEFGGQNTKASHFVTYARLLFENTFKEGGY